MVTHEPFCASYAKDVYMLQDGQITCRIGSGGERKEFTTGSATCRPPREVIVHEHDQTGIFKL